MPQARGLLPSRSTVPCIVSNVFGTGFAPLPPMPMPKTKRFVVMAAGLLILILLLMAILRRGGDGGEDGEEEGSRILPDTALVRRLPAPVASYLAECGYERTLTKEPVAFQRELNRCIAGLTAAMEAILRSDTARVPLLELQFSTHRQHMERTLERQGESLQAQPAREMLGSAAVLLANLWEARYAHVSGLSREVAQTRRTARELDRRAPLFDQREEVEEVLDRAGNAILLMAQEEARRAEPG